ncbi:MAG: FeoC-like transcriptional regulator [Thermoplasmatota archaeon]
MSKRKSIIKKIRDGKSSLEISRDLDMGLGTVKAMIDSLEYQGYLEEVNCDTKCSACPMGCSSSKTQYKMYKVTEKGEEL